MAVNNLVLRMISDKAFILALRKTAIDFIAICEDRLDIPKEKSALYNRRMNAKSNLES